MSNQLPVLICAEAAVKSKRPDYVSLFDPKADINDLKKCRSDPSIMKEAVKKLKEAGFSVTAVGRCTVHIRGTTPLFEKTFATKLLFADDSAPDPGSERNTQVFAQSPDDETGTTLGSLIPIQSTSAFAMLLDSVYLNPPASATSGTRNSDNSEERSKAGAVYLDEIIGLLGGNGSEDKPLPYLPTGEDVAVMIIDDDIYVDHHWFQSGRFGEKLRAECNDVRLLEHRYRGSHGTQVMSCLLSVAPDITPGFIQFDESLAITSRAAFDKCPKNAVPRIINCSWGECPSISLKNWKDQERNRLRKEQGPDAEITIPPDEVNEKFQNFRKEYVSYWEQKCMEREGQLLIWTSGNTGNTDQGRPAQAYLAHLPNVIVVGGAFPARHHDNFALDPMRPVAAQSTALGGMRYVSTDQGLKLLDSHRVFSPRLSAPRDTDTPTVSQAGSSVNQNVATTVCGVMGDNMIMPDVREVEHDLQTLVPTPTSDWTLTRKAIGTSYAAPQVAGVCSMILEVWPTAIPADVKAILTETSTPVTAEETGEFLKLWDAQRGVQVGMVHIGRAVELARFMALVSSPARSSPIAAQGSWTAPIIANLLREIAATSNKTNTLSIRGKSPFVNSTHIVSWDDALHKFGISMNKNS
jgi:hypothetical protein